MVKNLPCNAGDEGLIPGPGTTISQALNLHALESTRHSDGAHVVQQKILHDAGKIPRAATKTWHSQIN